MSNKILFWAMTAFTSIIRLLIIGRIGLTGDEAHYWTYTRYPSLSYFDHPPFVAWLIKPFTMLLGNTEFAVRLPAVLIFIAVSFIVYKLSEDMFGERTAFWTAALLNMTPVFSFLGAVITLPDTPLSLFWMMFVYVFYRLIKDNEPRYWYALGFFTGLALLSKYNAVFLPVSAVLYLACSKEDRHHLKRKEPYIALLIAVSMFLPVIIWNLQNSFASFGFQLKHGLGKSAPHLSLQLLAKCLGAQAAYVSPVFFVISWWALISAGIKAFKENDRKALFLFAFSFPIIFLFNAIASFNEILPHWPAMGYLVLSISAGDIFVRMWTKAWFKPVGVAGCLLGIFLCVIIPLQAMFKVIDPAWLIPAKEAARIEDGIVHAEKIDPTNELFGWKEAGAKVKELASANAGGTPFIFTHRHYIASQLSFYIPGRPRVYALSDRIDAYDFWQRDLCPLDGKDGIFVTNDYFYVDPSKIYPFKRWEQPVELDIYRSGKKVRIFWITIGRQFDLKALDSRYTSCLAGQELTVMRATRKIDYRLFWFFNRDMDFKVINYIMWKFTKFDTDYGFNSSLVLLISAVGIILWYFKRGRFMAEFGLFLGIIGIGGLLVYFMKEIFDRMRPLVIFGQKVRVFHELLERGSFPSGHTQIAFSVATYLTSRFKKYWWIFYSAALCMGLSRIYIGVHFPLDVLSGAIVGTAVAWIMIRSIKID